MTLLSVLYRVLKLTEWKLSNYGQSTKLLWFVLFCLLLSAFWEKRKIQKKYPRVEIYIFVRLKKWFSEIRKRKRLQTIIHTWLCTQQDTLLFHYPQFCFYRPWGFLPAIKWIVERWILLVRLPKKNNNLTLLFSKKLCDWIIYSEWPGSCSRTVNQYIRKCMQHGVENMHSGVYRDKEGQGSGDTI